MVPNQEEKQVICELLPFLRLHNDGTVDRLYNPPLSPPSPSHTINGVQSKDTVISPSLSVRLYLPNPNINTCNNNIPILVYFHGGGFCIESAFSTLCHNYINTLASLSNSLVVSVNYRLAPEHPLPAAYHDSWLALQWVASQTEPWLSQHGDFDRLYIGGDSAGANISHNIAMRAGTETLDGGVKIHGAFLIHPYFYGSKPVGSESSLGHKTSLLYKTWMVVYPNAIDGIDNPCINPLAEGAPCLSGLACRRLIVFVASKDELRERGVWYCDGVRESGWKGELLMFEVEGEGHGFHVFNPKTQNAKKMFKSLVGFIQEC